MAMVRITDYANRAESLCPQFLKRNALGDQSYFAKEQRAFGAEVQELENAAFQVYFGRGIDSALAGYYSATLDDIGTIVGELRLGRTDAEYAIALKARIQMNASQGEPERLIAALANITTTPGGPLVKVDLWETGIARVFLNVEDLEEIPANYQEIMDNVKSAGVSLTIQESTSRMFCFSVDGITPWYSGGKGFGNNDADENGGQLAIPLFVE